MVRLSYFIKVGTQYRLHRHKDVMYYICNLSWFVMIPTTHYSWCLVALQQHPFMIGLDWDRTATGSQIWLN